MNQKALVPLLCLVIAASGCAGSSSAGSSPDGVAESYVSSLTEYEADTEAAYDLLSSDVREQTEFTDYHQSITNLKSSFESQGVMFELLQVETLEQNENTSTVEVTMEMELMSGGTTTPSSELELIKEEGSWKVDEEFNPYDMEDDQTRDEPDVGGENGNPVPRN